MEQYGRWFVQQQQPFLRNGDLVSQNVSRRGKYSQVTWRLLLHNPVPLQVLIQVEVEIGGQSN